MRRRMDRGLRILLQVRRRRNPVVHGYQRQKEQTLQDSGEDQETEDPKNRRPKAIKKTKKKQLLSKATVGRGNPEAPKSRREERLARTRRIYIRDRWDCIAQKRKVIDAQSMIDLTSRVR